MNSEALSSPQSASGAEARNSAPGDRAALYPFLMGAEWHALDRSVQRFHGAACDRTASGRFQIRRGRSRVARFLASLLGLPWEGSDVETQLAVGFRPAAFLQFLGLQSLGPQSPGSETWRRNFANQPLTSVQYMKGEKILGERFRFVELSFRLSAYEGALIFESVGAALALGKLRFPLLSFLRPRIQGRVRGVEGFASRLHVSVQLSLPLIGPMLSYEGYLDPREAEP